MTYNGSKQETSAEQRKARVSRDPRPADMDNCERFENGPSSNGGQGIVGIGRVRILIAEADVACHAHCHIVEDAFQTVPFCCAECATEISFGQNRIEAGERLNCLSYVESRRRLIVFVLAYSAGEESLEEPLQAGVRFPVDARVL